MTHYVVTAMKDWMLTEIASELREIELPRHAESVRPYLTNPVFTKCLLLDGTPAIALGVVPLFKTDANGALYLWSRARSDVPRKAWGAAVRYIRPMLDAFNRQGYYRLEADCHAGFAAGRAFLEKLGFECYEITAFVSHDGAPVARYKREGLIEANAERAA